MEPGISGPDSISIEDLGQEDFDIAQQWLHNLLIAGIKRGKLVPRLKPS